MKTFLNKSLKDIIKSFNNKEYYYQNTLAQECIEYLEEHKIYLSSLEDVLIYHENSLVPHYKFENKSINIPLNYDIEFKNLYSNIESYLKDKTAEYIIFHEIGHAVQHGSIGNRNYKFEPIETDSSLNYLFNGAAIATKINHFLSDNYKESYADCYAAYVLYKKHNDMSIFNKIYQYRQEEKSKFKKLYPHEVNEYFSFESLKFLKQELKSDLSYKDVHDIINKFIIQSLINVIAIEIKNNDSFLKELNVYGKEFNKNNGVKGFLEEFKQRSKVDITQELDVILNDKDTFRNVDNVPELKNMRKNGHNFIISNINLIRQKDYQIKSLTPQ